MRPKVGESERETVKILEYETKKMDYLRWISRERERKKESKQARKKERKELREFYRIDDQKDQEIVECEINNFQIIRSSQMGESSKLNFLGKVIESEFDIGGKERQL